MKGVILSLFLYILSNNTLIISKIIPLSLTESAGTFDIFIEVGNNNQFQHLELDMSIDFMWVSIQNFKEEDVIRVAEKDKLIIGQSEVEGNKYISNMTFTSFDEDDINNITLYNFPFYYLTRRTIRSFDSFPLSFKIQNESYSFIHYLYNKHFINHKKFGLHYLLDKGNGTLYLGGLPENVLNKNPYKTSCKVNENYPSWGCNLTKVIVDNYTYINEGYSKFQSNQRYILAPKKFSKYLYDRILKPYITNGTCDKSFPIDNFYFDCKCNEIDFFPTVHFVFENTIFTLNISNLFDREEETCHFRIELNDDNETEWIFGIDFLSQYYSLYDYDSKLITFYNDIPFKQETERVIRNKKLPINIINITLIILMTFMIIILLIIKQKEIYD